MRKHLILLSLLVVSNFYAQIDLSGGMGISFVNSPDLKDYINFNFATTDKLSSFNSAADFFIEADYNFSKFYQIGVEYNLMLFSFNSLQPGIGNYDIQMNYHKPSVIGYYVIPGAGYKFKFGIGIGPRIVQIEEKIIFTEGYSGNGFGVLLKFQGDTLLSGNLYALIAGDLRYDFYGDLEKPDKNKINVNTLSAGIKLGVSYYF